MNGISNYVVKHVLLVALKQSCNFSREKSNELTDQQDMFCFNHASPAVLSIRATISREMLIDNKFEAQTVTGNSAGISRCHDLASRALNVSGTFGQSARSIESRCVVITIRRSHNYTIYTIENSMMTSSNGNIFRVTGHLCGEFTGLRWIPRTKASDAELWCFLDLRPNKRLSKQ